MDEYKVVNITVSQSNQPVYGAGGGISYTIPGPKRVNVELATQGNANLNNLYNKTLVIKDEYMEVSDADMVRNTLTLLMQEMASMRIALNAPMNSDTDYVAKLVDEGIDSPTKLVKKLLNEVLTLKTIIKKQNDCTTERPDV